MSTRKQAWIAGGLGLVTFTSLVGASSGVTGNGGISGRATITTPGVYTVAQNIDVTGTNPGPGTPVILIMLTGGQTVLDLDGHAIKRGPGGPVIELVCGGSGGEVTIRDGKVEAGSVNIKSTGCDVKLERVRAVNAVGDGIAVTGGSLRLSDSVIRNPGGDGVAGEAATIAIADSIIAGAGAEGLSLHTALRVDVARTTIRGARECGVDMDTADLTGPGAGATFTDVRILGLEGTPDIEELMMDGYHFNGRIPVTITGGLVRGASRYGMYFGENSQAVTITGAALTATTGPAAIQFVGQRGAVAVTASHLRGFAGDGIASDTGASGGDAPVAMRFENNVLGTYPHDDGEIYAGFRMDDASTVRLVGNSIEGTAVGISLAGDAGLIQANRIKEGWTDVEGIALDHAGIRVTGRGSVVRDNVVVGRQAGFGILVGAGATGTLVKNNRVRMYRTGLAVEGNATQVFARNNVLSGNPTPIGAGVVDAGGNVF